MYDEDANKNEAREFGWEIAEKGNYGGVQRRERLQSMKTEALQTVFKEAQIVVWQA